MIDAWTIGFIYLDWILRLLKACKVRKINIYPDGFMY